MKKRLTFVFVVSLLCANVITVAQDEKANNRSVIKPSAMQIKKTEYNEAKHASLYELVVIGRVIDIRGTPASIHEMFHSEVIIKIDSVLKGELNFKNMIIRLQSGPVTDGIRGGNRIKSSIEPIFKVGEQSVFFMNPAKKDGYLNSPFVKENYQKYNGKNSISELSDSTFWVANDQTFLIKDGMINYFGELKNKSDFIQNITKKKIKAK